MHHADTLGPGSGGLCFEALSRRAGHRQSPEQTGLGGQPLQGKASYSVAILSRSGEALGPWELAGRPPSPCAQGRAPSQGWQHGRGAGRRFPAP